MHHITQSYKSYCDCCAAENTTNQCRAHYCELANVCKECVDRNGDCAICATKNTKTLSHMRKCCLYRASVAMLTELEEVYDAVNYRNRLLHTLDTQSKTTNET